MRIRTWACPNDVIGAIVRLNIVRISRQAIDLEKGFNVREHAKEAILVEKSPNNLTVADWIVKDVPKVIFETE